MEEHPSLPKHIQGSGFRVGGAPRVFGFICQLLSGTNLDCPQSLAQGKSSTRERNATQGSDVSPAEYVLFSAKDSRIRLMSFHK